jgi:hypothetical protein
MRSAEHATGTQPTPDLEAEADDGIPNDAGAQNQWIRSADHQATVSGRLKAS